jgi:small subunit ribosomal protein S20
MPNSKQAAKRARQSEERRLHNKAVRSAMKSAVKRAAISGTPEASAAAMKLIDKAAKTNVIHRNAAARHKSRLARRLAKSQSA